MSPDTSPDTPPQAGIDTVPALLRRRHDRGEHALLICDDQRLGYAEAERSSAALARTLIGLGAGKGTHIGLLFPNGAEFVTAMLAAARIGAVVVPFSTFSTAAEVRTQLLDSDVEIMLAAASYRGHDYRQKLAEALDVPLTDTAATLFTENAPRLRRVLLGDQRGGTSERAGDADLLTALEDDVDPGDTLAVIYTSGSTGAPKGAVHTHGGLLEHQRNLNRIRRLDADDRLFCNSPFFWIGGFAFGLLATMTAGATLVCSITTDAGATLDLLEREKPTVTNGFAAGVAALTRHPSFPTRDLAFLRRGNLYPIMAPDARPADPELRHNMLGMTEAGSVVLLDGDDTDQPEHRRGSFGRPAPGFETKVVDPDTGAPVGTGEIGELCLRGPYLMQRYYGRSREDCFDGDGWFHTGDLVRTDPEGFVYFITRAGSMIKTAGANVTPAEVAAALTTVLGDRIHDAAVHVFGLPDPERGQVVAAVIATDTGSVIENGIHTNIEALIDDGELRTALRTHLSAYKVPRRFAVCRHAEVPLLSSGKVDLPRLAELFDG